MAYWLLVAKSMFLNKSKSHEKIILSFRYAFAQQ
jgi:hypothetical protein